MGLSERTVLIELFLSNRDMLFSLSQVIEELGLRLNYADILMMCNSLRLKGILQLKFLNKKKKYQFNQKSEVGKTLMAFHDACILRKIEKRKY